MTNPPEAPLSVEIVDGVAVIRMDDGKANAINHDSINAFHSALDKALLDARSVLVVGRPNRFSAGFDLSIMQAGDQPLQELVLAGADLMLRIYSHPQPTVAACTGHALAGGAILLMVCDTRFGVHGDFKIGLNEVGIGMGLPIFAVELARDRLDSRELTAATAQGQLYSPTEAERVGYLDQVVSEEQLFDAAFEKAKTLGKLRSGAVAASKKRLRGPSVQRIRATLDEDIAEMGFGTK